MRRRRGCAGCLLALPIFIAMTIGVYAVLVYPSIVRWEATALETADRYPGDELVSEPRLRAARSVTINAPREQVWSWLAQLGADRGGIYGSDWLAALSSPTVRSAAERQELQPGDFVRFTPTAGIIQPVPGFHVIALEAPAFLIGCFGVEGRRAAACAHAWQFILQSPSAGSTRLILRSHAATPHLAATAWNKALQFPAWMLERGILLDIKARAER
ncbi:MAG: hypothetical protein FJ011_25175 [Chloroflexi bacterium]|nr:hypothetical protein [Chloroflexota bacterium]